MKQLARVVILSTFLISSLGSLAVAQKTATPNPGAAPGTSVVVPGGTPVVVHVDQELSSASAHVGDQFSFSTLHRVVVNGWIVIPRGSHGVGEITKVDHAAGNGHPGALGLQFTYVYAADGEKIRLTATDSNRKGKQKKGASSTATILGYVLLGPLGLFAHNWVKGREVTVNTNKSFTEFTGDTVHVIATQRASSGDGFAHR